MTRSTTTFSRGDIVVVPYPFAELDAIKNRPALVLSTDALLAGRYDVVLAAITSRLRIPPLSGDYVLEDWEAGGLLRPSVVTGVLRTAKVYRILRKMGEISPVDLRGYETVLQSSLGL